ncbi:hypothetical protein IEO21_09096 [Rhodonia placenta]|uniref:Uncharacterized protein n=1 Tax=Rhodonia placenta TaxID=104341 RepID=A0A8H7NV42_9APHY|nr:hypothetical protein IEO21_09096 [Postia placenta]
MPRHQRPPRGLQQRDGAKVKMREDNKTQYVRKLPGTIVHGERLFGRFTAEAPSAPGVMGVLDFSNPPSSIAAKHEQTLSNASSVHPADELVVSRTETSNHQASRSNPSMNTSNPRQSLSTVRRPTVQHGSLAAARTHPQGHHPYHIVPRHDQDDVSADPLAESHMRQSSAQYHQLPQQSPQMLLSTWEYHQEVLTHDPFDGARPIPLPAAEQRLPCIVIDDASPVGSPGPVTGSPRGMDLHSVVSESPSRYYHSAPESTESSYQRSAEMPESGRVQLASFPAQLNSIHAPMPITTLDRAQIVWTGSTSALLPSLPTRISMDVGRPSTHKSQYGANLVALPRIPRAWDLTPSVTHDPILRPSNPLAAQLLQPALPSMRAILEDYRGIRERDPLYGSRPIPLPEVECLLNGRIEEALLNTGESTETLPGLTLGTTSISSSMHATLLLNQAPAKSRASYQNAAFMRGTGHLGPVNTEDLDPMQAEAEKVLTAVGSLATHF